jgi:hypothetical protein
MLYGYGMFFLHEAAFYIKNKKIRNRIGSKGGMTERRTKGNMNKGERRVEKNRKGEGTEGTYR